MSYMQNTQGGYGMVQPDNYWFQYFHGVSMLFLREWLIIVGVQPPLSYTTTWYTQYWRKAWLISWSLRAKVSPAGGSRLICLMFSTKLVISERKTGNAQFIHSLFLVFLFDFPAWVSQASTEWQAVQKKKALVHSIPAFDRINAKCCSVHIIFNPPKILSFR